MSLIPKSIYFSRDLLCFICFDVIISQWLKEMFKLVELFFQSHEWSKNVVLCNYWNWAYSEILSYSLATFSCLKKIHLNVTSV